MLQEAFLLIPVQIPRSSHGGIEGVGAWSLCPRSQADQS
jgi:hypothetical protein